MNVVETKIISNSEAKEIMVKRKKKGNLGYEQKLSIEHLKKFMKIEPSKIKILIKELSDIIRMGPETLVQIVNIMPKNADELEAVLWSAGERLPLTVDGPDWLGVSHDTQSNRDIVHLFNYRDDQPVVGITLECSEAVKKAWAISPDRDGRIEINIEKDSGISVLRIPRLEVYEVIVMEK